MLSRLLLAPILAVLLAAPVLAVAPIHVPRDTAPARPKPGDKLPLSKLAPAKLFPDLCLLKYPMSTTSPECQAYFDQGLGFYYSYVWLEAVRSFETALRHDPDCPLAWWGLSRAFERWHRNDLATKALLKAHELKERCSHREQQLIKASMQEKGQLPGVGDGEARKRAAINTLDTMLAIYDDDEEGWYFRAQLAGGAGLFGGQASAVPFYKALVRVNPVHPGANHELLHFYENFRRPALGWTHAENYIKSSPGIPHAFHMQAHLATRLGRWQKTSDRSARAIELERAYHKFQGVAPREDHQFSHHLETLLLSLIHDGRFAEGRRIKAEGESAGYKMSDSVFRLHLAERDFPEALKVVEFFRRRDKAKASYYGALVALRQGDMARAKAELASMQQVRGGKRNDRKAELKLWEVQGLYLCRTGSGAAGLKLLAKAVEKTKDDYGHHAWGNGAYYMESWGVGALYAGKLDVAEEAFLESLAHDPGSVRAALGLEVLCERLGRSEEASRYAALAARCWGRADPGRLQAELSALRVEQTPTDRPRVDVGAPPVRGAGR